MVAIREVVQAFKSLSALRDARNVEQPVLIPVGMRGFAVEVDVPEDEDAYKENDEEKSRKRGLEKLTANAEVVSKEASAI